MCVRVYVDVYLLSGILSMTTPIGNGWDDDGSSVSPRRKAGLAVMGCSWKRDEREKKKSKTIGVPCCRPFL
jgi:hypothetical protein